MTDDGLPDRPDRPDPLAMLRGTELRGPGPPTWPERVQRLVDRLPREARPWAAGVVGLVVIVLGLGAWSMSRATESTTDSTSTVVDAAIADLPMAGTAPSSPSSTAAPLVMAHAAGAVLNPGVYRLAPGARVTDLIDAAGGLASDADPDRLNMAAGVADGARVYVPRVGELAPPAAIEPETDSATPSMTGDASTASKEIDLNRAGVDELDTLPGIGPSIAGAIVAHRAANGPFASVDDLIEVRGIGPARLEQLRPLVRV